MKISSIVAVWVDVFFAKGPYVLEISPRDFLFDKILMIWEILFDAFDFKFNFNTDDSSQIYDL